MKLISRQDSFVTSISGTNSGVGGKKPQHTSAGTAFTSSDEYYTMLQTESLARAETRAAQVLRVAVIVVLLLTAAAFSTGVFLYTKNDEKDNFVSSFEDSALQIIEKFHETVERNIGASAAMSATITSYAKEQEKYTNLSFPFVTIPDLALRGSHHRVQSGSHIMLWNPLVTDDKREDWEAWALKNRFHAARSQEEDAMYILKQDNEFGVNLDGSGNRRRLQEEVKLNMTVLDDGYHAKIWRNGPPSVKGDSPPGSGPFLPCWQKSATDRSFPMQMNMDFSRAPALVPDIIALMLRERKALLNSPAYPFPEFVPRQVANLQLSQYREHAEDLVDGLSTFLAYPVFESFDEDSEVAGVLSTNIYWKILLSHLLPSSSRGIVCVVENSFNKTFTYRIDGAESSLVGMGDHHDPAYDDLVFSEDVNEYLKSMASPENVAYGTLPLSDATKYTISIYPSKETEDPFLTNKPAKYTLIVIVAFALASILFVLFSYVVEKRQSLMMKKVIENAHRATGAERELNEFLSHEVRNPLAAAISACCFVATAVNEPEPLADLETRKFVREDIEVVNSSLNFINDFLRSMLDIHRASGKKIRIELAPTDIRRDVLEPVSMILYKRVASFEVQIECPENLIVMTDAIRLKQVVLNLGPGIPPEKRQDLFAKYQESLDLLSQGTGIGLNLSKKLMDTMNGDIRLDESYNSGIKDCPGACFVVHLNAVPLDIESALPTDIEQEREVSPCGNDDSSGGATPGGGAMKVVGCEPIKDEGEDGPPGSKQSLELPNNLSVLFVDDDAVLRKLFVRAVKKVAPLWKIQEASSGEIAIRMCEKEAFDLIFLDQYMASVDKTLLGTETVQALRTQGVQSKICGLSANDLRASFMKAGADDFMMKPMPCKQEALRQALLKIVFNYHPVHPLALSSDPCVMSSEKLTNAGCCLEGKKDSMSEDTQPSTTLSDASQSSTRLPAELSLLFVDDDTMLRKLFVRAAKKLKPEWNVQQAASGEEALELCEGQGFDLIFLDQYMSSTEKTLLGTETAQVLRTRGVQSRLCGLSANELRDDFISAGANDFVSKPLPCKGDQLEKLLLRLLSQHSERPCEWNV